MHKAFAALIFTSLSLVLASSHAMPARYIGDEEETPAARYATFRCCAKPATYNDVNCEQGVDKLQAWGKALYICEYKYGKGNCVSSCRRIRSR